MGLHLLHFFSKFELLGRSDPSRLLVFGIFQHRADRRGQRRGGLADVDHLELRAKSIVNLNIVP